MRTADGRYVIVFNGEIYNFRALRQILESEGECFVTESDTEVVLRLFAKEGERMLSRLRGMFAFAIWDRYKQSLFCARDPYGIKPLYIAAIPGGWMVASQVKAILAAGEVSSEPDAMGQAGFWLLGSVPEPRTWFRDIRALPPGSWCRLEATGFSSSGTFWNIGELWSTPPRGKLNWDEAQHIVRECVASSVKCHLVADVPIGAFLSGGIDSGSLIGHMREIGGAKVHGVTLAFDEFRGSLNDEVPAAKQIARQYDVGHHIRRVGKIEFDRDIPRIIDAMDQPSIDGINTWYASKAVAELGLKVVVSGVGGDELFFGYPSFRQIPALIRRWRQLGAIPGGQALAKYGLHLHAARSGNEKWKLLPHYAKSLSGAYFLRRGLYAMADLPELMGPELAHIAQQQVSPERLIDEMSGALPVDDVLAISQLESLVYMRNQLLRDSDWASMAHSVELRTPLVDAWLLRDLAPVMRAFRGHQGKRLLAGSPVRPLDPNIVNRRKTGFGMPIGTWTEHARGATDAALPPQGNQVSKNLARRIVAEIYRQ